MAVIFMVLVTQLVVTLEWGGQPEGGVTARAEALGEWIWKLSRDASRKDSPSAYIQLPVSLRYDAERSVEKGNSL